MSSEKEAEGGTTTGANAAVAAWFGERLPGEWTATSPRVTVDREEIIVVLEVPAPGSAQAEPGSPEPGSSESGSSESGSPESGSPESGSPESAAEQGAPEASVEPVSPEEASDDAARATRAEATAGRIARFREETREHRIAIAREAEHRFGRKVAWGVRSGDTEVVFTSLAIPVMTRLRQSERLVLDTLVDAGVARSRAHGLAWCVRLVGDNAATWLSDLRNAMAEVEKVRKTGPN